MKNDQDNFEVAIPMDDYYENHALPPEQWSFACSHHQAQCVEINIEEALNANVFNHFTKRNH